MVLTYNLPGAPAIKLTPEVIARIFLGQITSWNDGAIAEINPGISLPNTPIAVVHRSGWRRHRPTIFTDYLSKVSPQWAKDVHTGKAVHWPAGTRRRRRTGSRGQVAQLPGAIGYVELA